MIRKEKILFEVGFAGLLIILVLTSCDGGEVRKTPNSTIADSMTETVTSVTETQAPKTLSLSVESKEVEVFWLNNPAFSKLFSSVDNKQIIELRNDGNSSQRGVQNQVPTGGEQSISVTPGDIVIANGEIAIYYESTTTTATKIGHINLGRSEIAELFGEEETVTITLELKIVK